MQVNSSSGLNRLPLFAGANAKKTAAPAFDIAKGAGAAPASASVPAATQPTAATAMTLTNMGRLNLDSLPKPVSFTAAGMAREFAKFDTDGDGKLTKDEFRGLDGIVTQGRAQLTEAATGRVVDGDYMFDVYDRDKAGFLTLAELLKIGYGQQS